jgi:hypothetical protein
MKMYIARDPNGDLYVHAEKPFFASSIKGWHSDNWMPVRCNEYPEVTFENSPMEVELKLIEK